MNGQPIFLGVALDNTRTRSTPASLRSDGDYKALFSLHQCYQLRREHGLSHLLFAMQTNWRRIATFADSLQTGGFLSPIRVMCSRVHIFVACESRPMSSMPHACLRVALRPAHESVCTYDSARSSSRQRLNPGHGVRHATLKAKRSWMNVIRSYPWLFFRRNSDDYTFHCRAVVDRCRTA